MTKIEILTLIQEHAKAINDLADKLMDRTKWDEAKNREDEKAITTGDMLSFCKEHSKSTQGQIFINGLINFYERQGYLTDSQQQCLQDTYKTLEAFSDGENGSGPTPTEPSRLI